MDRSRNRKAHCTERSFQRSVMTWHQLVISEAVRSAKKLVQPLFVLRRPLVCFDVLNDEEESPFVGRDESTLCTFEESTMRSHWKSLNLDQGLLSNVVAALRALSKNYAEDIFNAMLSSEQLTVPANNECK